MNVSKTSDNGWVLFFNESKHTGRLNKLLLFPLFIINVQNIQNQKKKNTHPQIHCGSNPRPCTKPNRSSFHRKQLMPRQVEEGWVRASCVGECTQEGAWRGLRGGLTPARSQVGIGSELNPKAVHVV